MKGGAVRRESGEARYGGVASADVASFAFVDHEEAYCAKAGWRVLVPIRGCTLMRPDPLCAQRCKRLFLLLIDGIGAGASVLT